MRTVAFELALGRASRDNPLEVREATRPYTCCLCGARQEAGGWRVTLPPPIRKAACPNCADDEGWTVR